MSKIGEWIHDWRVSQGLTQNQAANLLHVDIMTISHWEKERSRPGYDMIRIIHETTGGDYEDLF